jgi:hypothetical protein
MMRSDASAGERSFALPDRAPVLLRRYGESLNTTPRFSEPPAAVVPYKLPVNNGFNTLWVDL